MADLPFITRDAFSLASPEQIPSGTEMEPVVLRAMVAQGQYLKDIGNYNPDDLIKRKRFAIIDKMMRDDSVKAAMSTKMHAPISGGWSVVPAGEENRALEHAEFIEDNFTAIRGTVEDVLGNVVQALPYGFSIQELILGPRAGGRWSGKWMLDRIEPHAPHNIEWVVQNDQVVGVRQRGGPGEPVPVHKLLIYTWNGRFGNPWGQTDLDAAYRSWFSKDVFIKFWNMYVERYALDRLIVKYQQGKKGFADKLVDKWSEIVSLSVPDGVDIDIKGATGKGVSSAMFKDAIDTHNEAIARSILKQTLAQGEGQRVGSLAMARVHQDTFLMEMAKVQRDLEETVIGEQLIRLLIDINYGPQDAYPIFSLGDLFPEDPKESIEAYISLLEAGGITPTKADEDRIRDVLNMPAREGEDPPPGPGTPQIPGQSEEDMAARVKKAIEGSHEHRHIRAQSRQPRGIERRVDFAQIESRFDSMEDAAREELVALVQDKIKPKILSDVQNTFFDEGLANPHEVNRIHIPYLSKVRGIVEGPGLALFNAGIGDMREVAKQTLSAAGVAPEKFAPVNPGGLTYKQQLAAFKKKWAARSQAIATEFSQELERDLRNVLLRAMENGETQQATAQKVERVFEKWLPGTTKAGGSVQPWRAENIIRTNYTGAYAQGRLTASRDPDLKDFVRGYQYSAVLDDRTSDICESLDGLTLPANDPQVDLITPPNHFQCRGVLVEFFNGVDDDIEFADDQRAARAVAGIQEGFK